LQRKAAHATTVAARSMETIPDGGDQKKYFDAEVEVLTSILKKVSTVILFMRVY
jgi:hypothetical protein